MAGGCGTVSSSSAYETRTCVFRISGFMSRPSFGICFQFLVRERTFSTRTSLCGRVAHQERVFGALQLLDPTKGWSARAPRTEDAAPSNAETGGKVTACFRICTQAVIGNGDLNMGDFRDEKRNSVVERVSLACTRAVLEHQWISEFSMLMHEHDVLQRLNCGRFMNRSRKNARDSWWYIITERMS